MAIGMDNIGKQKPLKAVAFDNGEKTLVLIERKTEVIVITDKSAFDEDYSGLILELHQDGLVVEGSVDVGSIIKWKYIDEITIIE